MRYVKKTCILRQLSGGFSVDGKSLSGIIKIEQYGNSIGAEISIANLAPTTEGEYYCVLADSERRHHTLCLDEGTRFSFTSDMELASGFYAVLCFLQKTAMPIALGSCGKLSYDVFGLVRKIFSTPTKAEQEEMNADMPPTKAKTDPVYNDELVADENYYEKENDDEQDPLIQADEDAPSARGNSHQGEEERHDVAEDAPDESVRHAFTTETDGYYRSIQSELNALFERYPTDETLKDAYPHSEWVRIRGEADSPEELVGLIYEGGLVKYICYALPAREETPQDVKRSGYYVPVSPLTPSVGFYVLYQSAATGESIIKEEA